MATQYGMVINLERCIGCYACVVSCKQCWGTRPEVNYNMLYYREWGEFPDAHQRYVSEMCNHCENPPCVAACPYDATHKSDEGPVLIDYELCIGCGSCVPACPYGQRTLITEDETSFKDAIMPCEEESSQRLNITEKCTFCYERLQEGLQPMCAIHCPGQCRIFGDVNDPESEIALYIAEKNPTHLEGTSLYYVIPEGMDRSMVPLSLADAVAAQGEASKKDEAEKEPVAEENDEFPVAAVAVGAVAVAAVGGGVAYGVSKKKKNVTPAAAEVKDVDPGNEGDKAAAADEKE